MFRGLILRATKNSSNHVGNSAFQNVVNNIKDASKTVSSKASDLKDKVEDTYERMTDKRDHLSRDAEHLSDKIGDATRSVKHKMEDAAHTAKHKAEDVAQNLRHKAEDVAHNVKHKAEDVASRVQHSNLKGALGLDHNKDGHSIHLDDDYHKPVRKVSHEEQEEAYTKVTNPFADKKQTHNEMSHHNQKRHISSSTRGTHTSPDGVTKPVSSDSTIPWEHTTKDDVHRPTCTRNSMPSGNLSDKHFRGPLPDSQQHSDVVGSTHKNPIDKEFMDEHGGSSAYTPTMSRSEHANAYSYKKNRDTDTKETDHNLNYTKSKKDSSSWDQKQHTEQQKDNSRTYNSNSNRDSESSSKSYNKDMDTSRHDTKHSDRNTAAEKYTNADKNKKEMNYNKTHSPESHSGNKPTGRAFATATSSNNQDIFENKKKSSSKKDEHQYGEQNLTEKKRKSSSPSTEKRAYNTSHGREGDKEYHKEVYSYKTESSIPQSASRSATDEFAAGPHRVSTAQPIDPMSKTTSKSKNPTKSQKTGLFGADVRRAFSTLLQANFLDRPFYDFSSKNYNDLNSNFAAVDEQEEVNYYSRPHEFTNFEKQGGEPSRTFQSILDQHPGQDPKTILKKKSMEHPLTTHLSSLYQPRRLFATRFFGQNVGANSEFYYGAPGDGGQVRRFADGSGKINQSDATYNKPNKTARSHFEADQNKTEIELNRQNQDMNRYINDMESKSHEYSSGSRSTHHDDKSKYASRDENRSASQNRDVDSSSRKENTKYSSRSKIDNQQDFGTSQMRDSSSYEDATGKRHVDHELQEDLDGMHDKFDSKGKKKFSYDELEKEKNMRNAAGHVEPGNIFKRFYSSSLKDRIYKENDPDAKNFPFLQHVDDEEATVVPRATEHVYHVTPPNIAHNRKVEAAEHNEKVIPSRTDRRREFSTKHPKISKYDEDGISGSKDIRKDLEKHSDKLYDIAHECSFEGSGGSFQPEPKRHANAYDSKIDLDAINKKSKIERSEDKPQSV